MDVIGGLAASGGVLACMAAVSMMVAAVRGEGFAKPDRGARAVWRRVATGLFVAAGALFLAAIWAGVALS